MDVDSSVPDLFAPFPESQIETMKLDSPMTVEVNTENAESPQPVVPIEKNILSAVLQICKKFNLTVSIFDITIRNYAVIVVWLTTSFVLENRTSF